MNLPIRGWVAMIALALMVVGTSSCVSTLNIQGETPLLITVTTSTDHLGLFLGGVSVTESSIVSIDPPGVRAWVKDRALEAIPGGEMGRNHEKTTIVWSVKVKPAPDSGHIKMVVTHKGDWGYLNVDVRGLDGTGKETTVHFSLQGGPGATGKSFTAPISTAASAPISAVEPSGDDVQPVARYLDPAIIGTWGLPRQASATKLAFRRDGIVTVANLPSRDGKTVINGRFLYYMAEGKSGISFIEQDNPGGPILDLFYSFSDKGELVIAFDGGRGYSFLPPVK